MLADGLRHGLFSTRTDAYYSVAGYLETFLPKKTTLVKQFSCSRSGQYIIILERNHLLLCPPSLYYCSLFSSEV